MTTSDVLIRGLKASFVAKFMVQLIFGFGKPRNPVLGMVTSGVIESKGKNVTSFNIGDEVFAYGSVSPTKRHFGSYAEYICLPEDWNIALKPANLDFEETAAIPYGGLLASHLLKKTSIKKGDKVLIYGASGSISIDHGTPLTAKAAFLNLKSLAEQEKIKPVIDRVYSLEEITEAHQYVEKGHKIGNVVISV